MDPYDCLLLRDELLVELAQIMRQIRPISFMKGELLARFD